MLRRSRLTGKATLFEARPLAIAELSKEIGWLAELPQVPVRLSAIGTSRASERKRGFIRRLLNAAGIGRNANAKAIAADFQGVPFENFIVCDNLYKGYLQTQSDEMLDDLGEGYTNRRKRKRWFSRKYFASVHNIQEFFADNLGKDCCLTIANALNPDVMRRSVTK